MHEVVHISVEPNQQFRHRRDDVGKGKIFAGQRQVIHHALAAVQIPLAGRVERVGRVFDPVTRVRLFGRRQAPLRKRRRVCRRVDRFDELAAKLPLVQPDELRFRAGPFRAEIACAKPENAPGCRSIWPSTWKKPALGVRARCRRWPLTKS